MTRVYISGPMTGIENHNFPAFHARAQQLRDAGHEVVNPAEMGVTDGMTWADYMRRDIAELVTCEAISLLPGWESSRGARLEHVLAMALGMEILEEEAA